MGCHLGFRYWLSPSSSYSNRYNLYSAFSYSYNLKSLVRALVISLVFSKRNEILLYCGCNNVIAAADVTSQCIGVKIV